MDDKTTIQISQELKRFLKENGELGETYEDVIWKLIKKVKGGDNKNV